MPSRASFWARKIRTAATTDTVIEEAKSNAERTAEAPLLATNIVPKGTWILQFQDKSILLLEENDPLVPTFRPAINAAMNILNGKAVPMTAQQRELSDALKAWQSQFSNFIINTTKELSSGVAEQRETEIAQMLRSFTETLEPFTGPPRK